MKKFTAKIDSLYLGCTDDLGKKSCSSLHAELDGFVGDRHKSTHRSCWQGDKQPKGTKRRNERQWSAISVEELEEISKTMDLVDPISAASVGVNLCLSGVPNLSQLPMGTTLTFPSGAELMVEEYNPPCLEMGQKLAALHKTNSGDPIRDTAFSKAAHYNRGVVGVIEVEGIINAGDEVIIRPYKPMKFPTN